MLVPNCAAPSVLELSLSIVSAPPIRVALFGSTVMLAPVTKTHGASTEGLMILMQGVIPCAPE
eukprot:scaffold15551_cov62-Phaeocystis_antarctica.AAC.9